MGVYIDKMKTIGCASVRMGKNAKYVFCAMQRVGRTKASAMKESPSANGKR